MTSGRVARAVALIVLVAAGMATSTLAVTGDFDENGYVDLRDYRFFGSCFVYAGPRDQMPPACLTMFDDDGDGDIDLYDYAAFQRVQGHAPIVLRDYVGESIHAGSTEPYSGRVTCGVGGCHDIAEITSGYHFQQGRTELDGTIGMRDDYFQDGRHWMKSPGRYGFWSQVAAQGLAGKQSSNESEIDLTAYNFVNGGVFSVCGACHPGGGPGEFDRDGELLYGYYEDTGQFQFGYERLGKTLADVALDGDYTYTDFATGTLAPAPWNETGVSGPDCLFCHRTERMWSFPFTDMNHTWRSATLAAGNTLVDNYENPVPAFAAAGTAGQGWVSNIEIDGRAATVLQIDYSVGVTDGSLVEMAGGELTLSPDSLTAPAPDLVCLSCHLQTIWLSGSWFDPRDIHYAKFNNLSDDDPDNDVPMEKSTACNYCHPGGPDHNFAKGNNIGRQWWNELDWANFRSCRDCHLSDSPVRHPEAPEVPGDLAVHLMGGYETLSCQACHVPYALQMVWFNFADATATGIPVTGKTWLYHSADPLNPSDPDKSRYYPGFELKEDSDGVERLFPVSLWPGIYWADWDQGETPTDYSDDVLAPIVTWRIRQITGDMPLSGVTDDNGDGDPEINRATEILTYIQALKGNDEYERQIARNPVLVKGGRVWYEDSLADEGVSTFALEGSGIPVEWRDGSGYAFGLDHNVLAKEEAWGYAGGERNGCLDCHPERGELSPVFDRPILVDPYDENGNPVYRTVNELTAAFGHPQMPLLDQQGDPIMADSTIPYSPRQTCGGVDVGCHDIDEIANGKTFQQGRTDSAGNIEMKDNYFGDGRQWMRSPGRFGVWSQATTLQMAGKENENESVFDQSAFAWIRDCAGCHTGGGPSEFDRDGELLYNEATGEFGYEVLGKTAEDVALDGDYADLDFQTGEISPARWDITGVGEPDCLYCHRANRPLTATPYGVIDEIKHHREAALGAGTEMRDDAGDSVPAFAASATAAQGWYSNIEIVQDGFVPRALTLQIDYSVGVDDGSLVEQPDGSVELELATLSRQPPDRACWACHSQKETINGMVWFDGSPDVHYRFFNNLSDEDPGNDISGNESTACLECHPGGPEHNFAKGNDLQFTWRDDQDWVNFRSCRDCHLDSSPVRHPDAPVVPTYEFNDIHIFPMFDTLSCQACHVPYALRPAVVYFDPTAGGVVWPNLCCASITMQYYSADPLDPTNPDKSRWYPGLEWKTDIDGVQRLFPYVPWINAYWADWEDPQGTPEDLSDDLLTAIIEWRTYQVIDSDTLAVVTDDNGDGLPEMNRPEEILAFITALKGNDSYDRQVAARPVLVKGKRVWYEDPGAPGGVNSFDHEGTGMPVTWYYYIWGQDHNVLPMEESWGYGDDPEGCDHCHVPDYNQVSPVFDRLIMVDPYGPDGLPVYERVRDMTGVHPQG